MIFDRSYYENLITSDFGARVSFMDRPQVLDKFGKTSTSTAGSLNKA